MALDRLWGHPHWYSIQDTRSKATCCQQDEIVLSFIPFYILAFYALSNVRLPYLTVNWFNRNFIQQQISSNQNKKIWNDHSRKYCDFYKITLRTNSSFYLSHPLREEWVCLGNSSPNHFYFSWGKQHNIFPRCMDSFPSCSRMSLILFLATCQSPWFLIMCISATFLLIFVL